MHFEDTELQILTLFVSMYHIVTKVFKQHYIKVNIVLKVRSEMELFLDNLLRSKHRGKKA